MYNKLERAVIYTLTASPFLMITATIVFYTVAITVKMEDDEARIRKEKTFNPDSLPAKAPQDKPSAPVAEFGALKPTE